MCVGAMISICAVIAIGVAVYVACHQDVGKVVEKIDAVAGAATAKAPVDCDEGADYDSDVEAPSHKAIEVIIPSDAPPKSAISVQVYTSPRRRTISRIHSAPSFTVPLSPSDSPKCVF
jgi:hypothetical protein